MYELWGRDKGIGDIILLMKFPTLSITRAEVEEVLHEMQIAGSTDLEIREIK